MEREILFLPIESVVESPRNFFRPLPDEKLAELAESVREVGIIHALVVRPLGDGRYELISGHQRKRAAEKAGLKEVPCEIRDVDEGTAEMMLIDANIRSRTPTPMEMARAIRRKKEILTAIRNGREHFSEVKKDTMSISCNGYPRGTTRDIIAREWEMSGREVDRYDSLNDLIPELQQLVEEGKMGLTAGYRLAGLPAEMQRALWEAMGPEIASLTQEEARRLKEEADRGYFVLKRLQERVEFLEKELRRYEEQEARRGEIRNEIAKLQAQKKQLEYDIWDRESIMKRLQKKVQGKGYALLTIAEELGRLAQSRKPEIELYTGDGKTVEEMDKGTLAHVLKWARVVKDVGAELEAVCNRALFRVMNATAAESGKED